MTRAIGLSLCLVFVAGCTGGTSGPAGSGGTSTSSTSTGSTSAAASGKKPRVAWVTNGIADFWKIGEKGALDAGKALDCEVLVRMPPKPPDQKRMVQELLADGVDGIAISPIDPGNQGDMLKEISDRTKLVTHDSDAPKSDRVCYIGMSNYKAGRMCGELVKKALPKGGEVAIYVGRTSQDNARLRRQGLIDELMGRSDMPDRPADPDDAPIQGNGFTVVETFLDDFNFVKAKQQAKTSIVKYPKLDCMVGLFEYNPPILLDAVAESERKDQIRIVGFDENDRTLQGILDGKVTGTIVQNPYQYGYKSIEVLAKLARGEDAGIPKDKIIDIPARSITKDNVQVFWDELKKRTGKK